MRFFARLVLLALAGCAASAPQAEPVEPNAPSPVATTPECNVDIATCQEHGCNGWVTLRYDIGISGKVTNAVVTSACPPGFFDDAALSAVRAWTFSQKEAGRRGASTRLQFTKAP